jgi:hypothetical protein
MHGKKKKKSKSAYRVLVEKPEGKRPVGRPRRTRRWMDNITMDIREIGWGCYGF